MAKCTICAHERRHQIDIGLTHRVPYHVLARRFGLSADAIGRHAANHLAPQQRAAILAAQRPSAIDLEALQASEAEGLLSQLVVQRARLQAHSELAIENGDLRAAVAVERAILANLELVGRLLQQFVQIHEVKTTSILISPDYLRLRATLLDALRPFPAAAKAVGAALHATESEAARTITEAAHGPPKPLVIEHQAEPEAVSS